MPADICAIVSAIRITGNTVPVKGRCITESAKRHGRPRLDLASSRDDRSFKNPEKLVGVPVGMATGTRESFGAGGTRIIEGNTATFEWRGGGVVEFNGRCNDWVFRVRKIDLGNGILNGIEDPSLGWSSSFIRSERNTPRDRSYFDMPHDFAAGSIHRENLV